MNLKDRIHSAVREVPDFPKPGILFRDITPVLADPVLCIDIAAEMQRQAEKLDVNGIVGIESRGFLFGMLLASRLRVPFIPVRKQGKLPYKKISHAYDLEYGSAVVEMHSDAVTPGMRILVHDDLLATGGTAVAAASLVQSGGGTVAGFSFLIGLDFLNGAARLENFSPQIFTLVNYS